MNLLNLGGPLEPVDPRTHTLKLVALLRLADLQLSPAKIRMLGLGVREMIGNGAVGGIGYWTVLSQILWIASLDYMLSACISVRCALMDWESSA